MPKSMINCQCSPKSEHDRQTDKQTDKQLEFFFITHRPTGSIYMSPKAPTAEVNHNNLRYPMKAEIERDQ